MRFLRGLGLGILMFFLWVFASVMGAFQLFGEYGFDTEVDLANISPIWSIPMVIGFLGMFLAPLYYWVIEPLRSGGKKPPAYSTPPSIGGVAEFCPSCGEPNPSKAIFCIKCGASLRL